MKKKILSLLAIMAFCCSAQAQTTQAYWRIYPKIGLALMKFPNDKIYVSDDSEYTLKSRYKQGFTAGVEIGYEKGNVGFQIGLMYANKGTKYSDFKHETQKETEKVEGVQYTLHYLEMPLTASISIARGLSIKAGVQPGYLLNARYMENTVTTAYEKDGSWKIVSAKEIDEPATDTFRRFALSIPVGLSYEIRDIIIDARYVIGVTSNSEYFSTRNSGFLFTVGYGFDL
jgi:hypothetical protein